MDFELPTGETHTMERKRGVEHYELKVGFVDADDGSSYSLSREIDYLVDDTPTLMSRSDITQDMISEAIDGWFDWISDEISVESVISIEVVESQVIRKTPYSEREWPE